MRPPHVGGKVATPGLKKFSMNNMPIVSFNYIKNAPNNLPSNLPSNMNTYILSGHAFDISLPSGDLDINTLPPGNMFLNITKTGITSIDVFIENLVELETRPEERKLLFDPVSNLYKLKEILENPRDLVSPDSTFHKEVDLKKNLVLMKEGDSYINNQCSYLSQFPASAAEEDFKGESYILKSGLYKLDPERKLFNQHRVDLKEGERLTEDDIHTIYDGAIIPDVKKLLSTLKSMKKYYKDEEEGFSVHQLRNSLSWYIEYHGALPDQKTLFEKYPGIHYNFGCRSFDLDKHLNGTPQLSNTMKRDKNTINSRRNYETGLILRQNQGLVEFFKEKYAKKPNTWKKNIQTEPVKNLEGESLNRYKKYQKWLKSGRVGPEPPHEGGVTKKKRTNKNSTRRIRPKHYKFT